MISISYDMGNEDGSHAENDVCFDIFDGCRIISDANTDDVLLLDSLSLVASNLANKPEAMRIIRDNWRYLEKDRQALALYYAAMGKYRELLETVRHHAKDD